MPKSLYYIIVVTIVVFGCSPSSVPSSSNGERYSEDLSALRPKYEVPEDTVTSVSVLEETDYSGIEIENDISEELNTILDSIDVLNSNVRYIDGYTVQVYYGSNSSEASLVKGKVKRLLPQSSPQLRYDEPNFRVKVGKFYSRLEAQETYTQLKSSFSSALIIPERIYIK